MAKPTLQPGPVRRIDVVLGLDLDGPRRYRLPAAWWIDRRRGLVVRWLSRGLLVRWSVVRGAPVEQAMCGAPVWPYVMALAMGACLMLLAAGFLLRGLLW